MDQRLREQVAAGVHAEGARQEGAHRGLAPELHRPGGRSRPGGWGHRRAHRHPPGHRLRQRSWTTTPSEKLA